MHRSCRCAPKLRDVQAVTFLNEEKIATKVEYSKNTFILSDSEVGISKDMLKCKSEFLISEVGLEPAYIARRPVMLGYSLEDRLKPRYYIVKFNKANGLLDHDWESGTTIVQP